MARAKASWCRVGSLLPSPSSSAPPSPSRSPSRSPSTTRVRLRPMTPAEYADFVPMQVAEFALQMTFAGEWELEDALDKSLARGEMLFDGTAIHGGHRFFRALAQEGPAAWVWEGPSPTGAPGRFLYQITVEEALRGRGLGDATLDALERRLAREGVP